MSIPRLLFLTAALAAWLLASHATARAEVQTFAATHTYVMGDSETRNQAREQCLLEAKRTLLEKVGAYTQITSKTEDFVLTEDEVRTFAAGFLQTEVVSEQWKLR